LQGDREKEKIHLGFEDALTLADDDIDENWEVYKQRFLEGYKP